MNDDTIKLLNECNAGTKMAVSSIDEVLPKVKNKDMEQLLSNCKNEHEQLGNEIHRLLNEYHDAEEEPSPIAKGMSWIKTNAKLTMNPTDNTAADLIVEGCNMGVKSLSRYLNQYKAADQQSKNIAQQLIHSEEQLSVQLRPFL
jgi:ATP-dependent Clp protease ATP-binding subunit ClpA